MTRHTIERCYEVVGYPPEFKKKSFGQSINKSVSNNVSGKPLQKSR